MGADLYIRRITEKAREENEEKFKLAVQIRDSVYQTHGKGKAHTLAQEWVVHYHEAMYPDEGYFRDSYNDSSVLWQMGLSWWQDVIPLCDKPSDDLTDEGREAWYAAHPDNLDPQKLLDLIRPKMAAFKKKMKNLPGTVDDSAKAYRVRSYTYTQEDKMYYLDKAAELIKFLETAVLNGDRIYASL